ncbi:MAG: noncanonical pyrimidine nucleotidase, YjjG family [Clostridiales bacterium]|nr:noncanonical pyrimidine nucleotidase, YjjG family [Clostridiales bacterium]
MIRYPYVLLDADNTLFDFDTGNRNAFRAVCETQDIPDTDENFALYETCNNAMWAAFDRGECTKDFIVIERFRIFLNKLGLRRDPAVCNQVHLTTLGKSKLLLPHAEEVCRTLSRQCKLYIVTNAVAAVQKSRLAGSGVAPYIEEAFISEDAGASKPSKAYFNYVFGKVPALTTQNCLLVGDSLSSDIQGANNAGLPCCWFNRKGYAHPEGLRIDYEIADLRQLYNIIGVV